ncbi:hypothetical protein HED54_09230 [Ochrobactrum anthropi ATCC 49188]|nr:hypothetical protein [Brucella anthropi ATCC 49188]
MHRYDLREAHFPAEDRPLVIEPPNGVIWRYNLVTSAEHSFTHEKPGYIFRLAATIGSRFRTGQNPDGYFWFLEAHIRLQALIHAYYIYEKPGNAGPSRQPFAIMPQWLEI